MNQTEAAPARHRAGEEARVEQALRNRRRQLLGCLVMLAMAGAVLAAIVGSGSGGDAAANAMKLAKQIEETHKTCQSTDTPICKLLKGIPEHGETLGSPHAKVSIVEYGDLECSICRDFALSSENQLISKAVRSGKASLTYRSLETASGGAPNPHIFGRQQAAAYAAGLQGKAWYYIEFFYHEQGEEGTGYVTQGYLDALAKQAPGLSYGEWRADSERRMLIDQIRRQSRTAVSYLTSLGATSQGQISTPTILITGPKGMARPIVGDPTSYAQLASAINSVQ